MAVAAAGNNWIPASVYNIILNVVDAGMPAQAAIEAPRFLIGRDPADPAVSRVQIEDRIPRAVLQDLAGQQVIVTQNLDGGYEVDYSDAPGGTFEAAGRGRVRRVTTP